VSLDWDRRRRVSASAHARSLRPSARLEEISALHRYCGVYTQADVVGKILDAVGWNDTADLPKLRLLEPAAGDGAFVTEAARRLVLSFRKRGVAPTTKSLRDCIVAFEIHAAEARKARTNVSNAMRSLGVHHTASKALARAWIRSDDFLLSHLSTIQFTHAVGNPPYVRWAKVPKNLRAAYENVLPGDMIGGDLFLPFLDRALMQLRQGGRCGFLCSDRWRYMAFAQKFRTKWLSKLKIESEES